MPIEVELPNGTILEYPDGTPQDVMQKATAQAYAQTQPKAAPDVSMLESGARGAEQSATFGFGDEIKAGIGAGVAKVFGGDATAQSSMGDLYDEALTAERAKLQAAQQANPGTYLGGSLAGAVITPAGMLGEAKTVSDLAKAGTGMGLLYGAGASEAKTGEGIVGDAALGGAVGGVLTPVVGKTLNALRPSVATDVNPEAVKLFNEAGVTPSLAAVSDSPAIKTTQNLLSRFPGSSSVIDRSVEKTKADIISQLENYGVASAVTPQQAGEVIESGIRRGINRGQERAAKVYSIFEKEVSPKEAFDIPNSQALISSVATRTENPAVLSDLQGKQGFKLLQQMAESGQEGKLNYQDIKYFRSKIGALLGDNFTIGGSERPLLKEAYGALTSDMRAAAASKGEKALRAFDRSNELYSKFITDTDNNLASVLNKNAPEQMYQALKQGTKLGGTKAESIMSQLNSGEREIVRGSVLQELGGGAENFDPLKAISAFGKLAPEAKAALFKGSPSSTIDSYNKLSQVVDRLQKIKEYGNPSGSGYMGNLGLFLGGAGFGGVSGVASAGAVAGGANISAKLMTNPKFINWLAQGVENSKTPEMAARHLSKLQQITKTSPAISEDIIQYLSPASQGVVSGTPSMKDVTPILPKKVSSIESTIEDAATFANIEPQLLKAIAQKESGLNPDAKNPNSSATGLFQITKPTWNGLVDKYGDQTGIGKGDVNDPQANATMGALLTSDNTKQLASALSRQPTPGEVYIAHFLGADGAEKLISNLGSGMVAARLFPAAAKSNKTIFFDGRRARTADEVYSLLSKDI